MLENERTRLTAPQLATPLVEEVGRTGIYPASGPHPPGASKVVGQGEFAHPEEREQIKGMLRSWSSERVAQMVGRAVFGGYFLYNGLHHFLNHRTMTDYARSKGVPLPGLAVAASGGMILLGGFSILTGALPKVGTSLITTFLLGVSPKMHAFWQMADRAERQQEMINFTKNMALVGGAALAAALPEPWPVAMRIGQPGALARPEDVRPPRPW